MWDDAIELKGELQRLLNRYPKAKILTALQDIPLRTAAVGLVPGHEMIGIWGAVILTLLRLSKGSGSAALLPDCTNKDISTEAHYEDRCDKSFWYREAVNPRRSAKDHDGSHALAGGDAVD